MKSGSFTKHPFKIGCLGFQVLCRQRYSPKCVRFPEWKRTKLFPKNLNISQTTTKTWKEETISSKKCYTPGSSNTAGWKMDPDWRCISYRKWGYSSQLCYSSLPEGSYFFRAPKYSSSASKKFDIQTWIEASVYRPPMECFCGWCFAIPRKFTNQKRWFLCRNSTASGSSKY